MVLGRSRQVHLEFKASINEIADSRPDGAVEILTQKANKGSENGSVWLHVCRASMKTLISRTHMLIIK